MRCGSQTCPYNRNGQCTVSEFDECPCLALVNPPYDCEPRNDVVGNERMLYGDDD